MKKMTLIMALTIFGAQSFAIELLDKCEKAGFADSYDCFESDSSYWGCEQDQATYDLGFQKGIDDEAIDFGACSAKNQKSR